MVLSPQQRTGIAPTNRFAFTGSSSPYRVGGTPASNPQSTIPTNQGNRLASAAGTAPKYTFPSDLPKAHINFIECEIARLSSITSFKGILVPKKMYRLPIPTQTTDSHSVMFNDNFSYLDETAKIGGNLLPFSEAAARMVASLKSVVGVVSAATGYTINTFKGVAMEQPTFKKHQFTWKLSPKNAEESMIIQRMIWSLKTGMTPAANKEANKFVLDFPKVFVPYFHPNVQYMYKFKPCVIEKLDVDFGGANPQHGWFKDTYAPESVVVTMSLLEIEYWLAGDFSDIDSSGLPSQDPFAGWNHNEFKSNNGDTITE